MRLNATSVTRTQAIPPVDLVVEVDFAIFLALTLDNNTTTWKLPQGINS